jgi:hypothetical protein
MKKLLLSAALVAMPVMAFATGDWYDITLSTTPVTTAAGVVITALAAVWAIRKVIKLVNRS